MKGEVDVTTEDGNKHLRTMGAGEYFGEAALFHNSKRRATVHAKLTTSLLVLTKEKIHTILGG